MSANLDVSNILAHHSFSLVGSTVDICGPFGSVQGANAVLNASSVILVGGGIGIAPLISFLDALFIKLSAQLLERAGGGGRSNLQSAAVWGQVSFFFFLYTTHTRRHNICMSLQMKIKDIDQLSHPKEILV